MLLHGVELNTHNCKHAVHLSTHDCMHVGFCDRYS